MDQAAMDQPMRPLPRDKGRMVKALRLSPSQRLELLERMVREARLLRQLDIAAGRRVGVVYEPRRVLATFADHQVDSLVIGGVAAAIHGSIRTTADVHVLCRDDATNRERLEAALSALNRAAGRPEDVGAAEELEELVRLDPPAGPA